MAAKPQKRYGSPILQVRTPRPLHRKLRALAKVYGATLPVFCRELFMSLVDGDKAREFHSRLNQGMLRNHQRELELEDGKFTAPERTTR